MRHGGNVWRGGAPESWLDFSANIRPDGPPDWVQRAMEEGLARARYYPDPEQRAAREALGAYLGLDADWVLPTAGGISAIDMAAQLPSRAMYVFSPAFSEYAQQAAAHGLRAVELPLLSNRRLLEPAEALGETDISDCAVWLCNPMNPVGAGFDARQLGALLERAEAQRAWLVIDEAFIACCPQLSSVKLLKTHPRLVITGSMTKALGIPGVRLGYLCASPDVVRQLRERQMCWELDCVAEAVLLALPERTEALRRDARDNERRREALRRALEALGAFVYPSQANFLLADFGQPVAPLEAQLLERGILVRSCMNFSGIDDGRHLRLAVKGETDNARLIKELREAMAICAESR